jgi:hypothetical protein
VSNQRLLAGHLLCAAAELPLTDADHTLFGDGLTPLLLHDFKKRSKSKAVFRASMK